MPSNTTSDRPGSARMIPLHAAILATLGLAVLALGGEPAAGPSVDDGVAKEIERLGSQITDARNEGRYDDALRLAQRLRSSRLEQYGPDHWETADAVRLVETLGTVASLPAATQAELAEADGSEARIEELFARGKYDEALELARRQLGVRVRILGSGHADVVASLNNVSVFLEKIGRFGESEALNRHALAVAQKALGNRHPDVADTMVNLAALLKAMGKLLEAESLYRDAMSIYQETRGKGHASIAIAMNNLAALLEAKGEFHHARSLYQEAIVLRRRLFGNDHPSVATGLQNLGALQHLMGELATGESNIREALRIWQARYGERHPNVAIAKRRLADLLAAKGKDADAEALYREVINLQRSLHGTGHPSVARTLSQLGRLLRERGNRNDAASLLKQAHEILAKALGERHPDVAVALNNLASVEIDLGHADEAESLLHQAIEISRYAHPEHTTVAMSLTFLAEVLERRGALPEAEAVLREALEMRRRLLGDTHRNIGTTLLQLGQLLELEGKLDEAESSFRDAVAVLERQRPRISGAESDRALYADALRLPDASHALSRFLLNRARADEAIVAIERGRSRALLDLLARTEVELSTLLDNVTSESGKADFRRLEELERARRIELRCAESAHAAALTRKDLSESERESFVRTQHEEVVKARGALEDAGGRLVAQLHEVWPEGRPASTEEIREALAPDEMLLSYTWSDRSVLLIEVSPKSSGGVHGIELAHGQEAVAELAQRILALRDRVSARPTAQVTGSIQRDLHSLAGYLVPPSLREHARSARRIIVVPDGPLVELPFELLPVRQSNTGGSPGGAHVEEGISVCYAESATVFLNRRKRSRQNTNTSELRPVAAVVLGNPQFEPPQAASNPVLTIGQETDGAAASALDHVRLFGGRLAPIPGTQLEAGLVGNVVRRTGGTADLLVGCDATLTKLEQALSGKTLVHLATHGLPGSRMRPYDAGLALAQPDTPSIDDFGFLTLEHLIRRWRGKLNGCEMVVLSACETQRGVRAGGSVMALPWGFMYAGAPTVVASLWKVDDAATALLMERFYENSLGAFSDTRRLHDRTWPAGSRMPKAEALCEAKQWLRTRTSDELPALASAATHRGILGGQQPAQDPVTWVDPSHPYYWAGFILLGSPD